AALLDPDPPPAPRLAAPAPVRRALCLGPDPPRHRDAPARDRLERRSLHHGEPRPRDVVPPPLPGRRVAAVRAGESVGIGRARPGDGSPVARGAAGGVGGAGGADASGGATARVRGAAGLAAGG